MKLKDEELKDSNWCNRRDNVEKLARAGTPDSIVALIQALHDPNNEVAKLAEESLVNIGTPRTNGDVPFLSAFLCSFCRRTKGDVP